MNSRCEQCGSFAMNMWQEGVSTELCDVCYWKDQASQVDDLKARLRAVRKWADGYGYNTEHPELMRATNLRVKNWSKP